MSNNNNERRILKPIHVHDCDCGGRHVTKATDGLTETFTCWLCGTMLAELIVNAEP